MSDPAKTGHDGLVSILIPVYNERAYLRRLVERVMAAPLPGGLRREIVLVDDCSKDGTSDLVRALAEQHPDVIRAFRQERNQGKGAAIRRAIAEMRGQYAIFQDADLEYDPEEYPILLNPILEGRADVVYGSRFAASPERRVLNYHHALGNRFLTFLSNWFTGLNLTDMETCYKVFRADILKTIPLRSNRFGIEPEITAKVAKRGCVVYEVPISYHGRTYAEGKKINWKDGFSALKTILKYWIIDDCYDERYGHQILADLSRAHRFNRWMVRVIESSLGARNLEIGAGIGNISRLLPKRELLTVTDVDPQYVKMLRDAFRDNDLVRVAQLDLNRDGDFDALQPGNYDSVVCLNVLEHIENDEAALNRIARLLRPGGKLILLVPQYPSLYGSYDKRLGHHRRYERRPLAQLLRRCGYEVASMRNFNSLAVLGWWLNSRVLQRDAMGRVMIKLFDLCVPLLSRIEPLLPLPGLSLVVIAQKPDTPRP